MESNNFERKDLDFPGVEFDFAIMATGPIGKRLLRCWWKPPWSEDPNDEGYLEYVYSEEHHAISEKEEDFKALEKK